MSIVSNVVFPGLHEVVQSSNSLLLFMPDNYAHFGKTLGQEHFMAVLGLGHFQTALKLHVCALLLPHHQTLELFIPLPPLEQGIKLSVPGLAELSVSFPDVDGVLHFAPGVSAENMIYIFNGVGFVIVSVSAVSVVLNPGVEHPCLELVAHTHQRNVFVDFDESMGFQSIVIPLVQGSLEHPFPNFIKRISKVL